MTPKMENRSLRSSSGKWVISGTLLSPMRPTSDNIGLINNSFYDDIFKTPEFLKHNKNRSLLQTPSPISQSYKKFKFNGSNLSSFLGDGLISMGSTQAAQLSVGHGSSPYDSSEKSPSVEQPFFSTSFNDISHESTGIQLIHESFDNSYLEATSTPIRNNESFTLNRRKKKIPRKQFVPRTPTPFKKAYAAAERKGGRIEPVDLQRSPQLLDDLQEIIQNETGSARSMSSSSDQLPTKSLINVTNAYADADLTLTKKSVHSSVANPYFMSGEWLDITCGRTPVQLEITEKAKRLLGLN